MDNERTGGKGRADAGFSALMDLNFERFITLSVMKVLYVLGLVVIALVWLGAVITGFSTRGVVGGLGMLVAGTLIALMHVIFLRVWLELIVVIFRIGENTSKMAGAPPLTTTPGSTPPY